MQQTSRQTRILAISGSLRTASSNSALLRAAAIVAPDTVEVMLYEGLADLPYFNPDLDRALDDPAVPASVRDLRARIGAADGVLISSPEYAHGVPGVLKNALDWLVGGSEIVEKPVALINASPHSTHAQASLSETLRTMSACLVEEASIIVPLAGRGLDDAGMVSSPDIANALRAAVAALARAHTCGHAALDEPTHETQALGLYDEPR